MTAHDNLSPAQFFHGTAHEFAPGDMVEPGHVGKYRDKSNKIWMHKSRSEAARYGSHVYGVEPTGILYDDIGDGGRGSFSSTDPARVVGEA